MAAVSPTPPGPRQPAPGCLRWPPQHHVPLCHALPIQHEHLDVDLGQGGHQLGQRGLGGLDEPPRDSDFDVAFAVLVTLLADRLGDPGMQAVASPASIRSITTVVNRSLTRSARRCPAAPRARRWCGPGAGSPEPGRHPGCCRDSHPPWIESVHQTRGDSLHRAFPVLAGVPCSFTRDLPLGRSRVGDRHLKLHNDRDNLARRTRAHQLQVPHDSGPARSAWRSSAASSRLWSA
jgi:hypothetical protein